MEPTYRLEGVIHSKEEMEDFEGPLNLILMLLSKNKIEIRDIRISEILDQYLDYLARMEEMDLEVTSEFVQMASHLLYIKTKMLLASQEEVSELELLMTSLEQLKARDIYGGIRQITPQLGKMSETGARLHVKQPEPLRGSREYRYRHEPYELLKALSAVYSRGRTQADTETERKRRIFPKRIVYNVRDKSREIIERFRSCESVRLSTLYAESRSRSEVVATFISILELCSMGDVHLEADGDDIIVSFAGTGIDAVLEEISR
jgi:segregation and condensation protein A